MSLAERRAAYAQATQQFFDVVDALTDEVIDRHRNGGWTPRQVLHHMADSEMQSAIRLRRLVAEAPGTTIQGYDEAAWAETAALGYQSADWRPAVALVAAVRASSMAVLERLSDADLQRTGVHTESGPYSIDTWLDIYTRHPQEHAEQILEAIAN